MPKQERQLQLNSERTRRALVREAEGKKQAANLAADAELYTDNSRRKPNACLPTLKLMRLRLSQKQLTMAGKRQ
jgi:hypothetical protein